MTTWWSCMTSKHCQLKCQNVCMACLLVNVCMSFIDKVIDCFLAKYRMLSSTFFHLLYYTVLQSNKEGVQSVYHASATEGHMQEILGTDYDDKFHKLQYQWSHWTSHHHCQTRLFMHTTYSAMTKVIDSFKLCHKKLRQLEGMIKASLLYLFKSSIFIYTNLMVWY